MPVDIPKEDAYIVMSALRGPDFYLGAVENLARELKAQVTCRLRSLVFTVDDCKGNWCEIPMVKDDLRSIHEYANECYRTFTEWRRATSANIPIAEYPRAYHMDRMHYTLMRYMRGEARAMTHFVGHLRGALHVEVVKNAPVWGDQYVGLEYTLHNFESDFARFI